MHAAKSSCIYALAGFICALPLTTAVGTDDDILSQRCRYLPGDPDWPTKEHWDRFNLTIGGKLIRGAPLAQSCYSTSRDPQICSKVRDEWVKPQTYYEDPVNTMSPYWLNDTCSPFVDFNTTKSCTLGNMAVYAVDVDNAKTVGETFKFARKNNIRLSIKNTGHDYVGRSNGEGSLALWMHHLKDISFFNYSSPSYNGPAAKLGAGVQAFEAYKAAADQGLRIVGPYCSTVGLVGGYTQGGGHGPLVSSYGLGADNTLEFEVITADGKHLIALPSKNADLYWALSGGGPGTYGVVLSVTVKAHRDGPTAGGAITFSNIDPDSYWKAIAAWQKHLLVLDLIEGFGTAWGFSSQSFSLFFATLPGGTQSDMKAALEPFIQELQALGITLLRYETTSNPSFYDHYQHYIFPPEIYATNNSMGGRLIQRSTVQNNLTELIETFKKIAYDPEAPFNQISGLSSNVSHSRVGNKPGANAVLPAWRDSLYILNVGVAFQPDVPPSELQRCQAKVNQWQDLFKPLTPGGGAYINEATFDDLEWKMDYFGENYERLLEVKKKYDPNFALWQHTSVGSDESWNIAGDGRLCRSN